MVSQRRLSLRLRHLILCSAVVMICLVSRPSAAIASPLLRATTPTIGQIPVSADRTSPQPTLNPQDIGIDGTVQIDGSSLMEPINQALKQRFETEFPGTDVTLQSNGTEAAIEALLNDDIDLAAIGRSLTPEEKQRGLVEVPVSQDAISIIIGRQNSFTGHLTLEQFAQIFRGEMTNWADVGGTSGPIRFIDRPRSSDTRLVLSQYGILGANEQAEGPNVVRVEADDTAEVIRQLGRDGISYAIASQVKGQRDVKLVKMAILLDTLPTDRDYPYTQIRGYAYRRGRAATVRPFLELANGESGKAAVVAAKVAEAKAVDQALNPSALNQRIADTSTAGVFFGNGFSDIPIWLWGLLPLSLLLLLVVRQRSSSLDGQPEAQSAGGSADSPSPQPTPSPAPSSSTVASSTAIDRSVLDRSDDDASVTSTPAPSTSTGPQPTSPPIAPTTPSPVSPVGQQTPVSGGDRSITDSPVTDTPASNTPATVTDISALVAAALASQSSSVTQPPASEAVPPESPVESPPIEDTPLEESTPEDALLEESTPDSPEAEVEFIAPMVTPPAVADTDVIPAQRSPAQYYDEGWALLKDQQYSAALDAFNQALEADSNWMLAWIAKGMTLLKLQRYQEAIASFDQGMDWLNLQSFQSIPGGRLFIARAWLQRGQAKFKAGQPQAALADLEQAIQRDNTCVDAWTAKGDALMALGQTQQANVCYQEANTLLANPSPTAAPETTEDFTDRIIAVPSPRPITDLPLPRIPTTTPPWAIVTPAPTLDDATQALFEDSSVDWNDADALYQKGIDCLTDEQFQDAQPWFRRVIELMPTNMGARINLGTALLRLGQGEAALTQFNQAIELDTKDPRAWLGQGDTFTLLGRSRDAETSYAQAAALQSGHPSRFRLQRRQPERPVPTDRQLLDIVLLVNTTAPLQAEVSTMQQWVEGAIATTQTTRPSDIRMTWLGTHGSWNGTPIEQSVFEYLDALDRSPNHGAGSSGQPSSTSSNHIISHLIGQFDWRPGAAQSLFYLSNGAFSSADQAGLQSIIETAQQTGTTINTYLVTAKSSIADPASLNAVKQDYKQVAIATGGLAFSDQETDDSFHNILEQTLEHCCRQCIHRRLTINSSRDSYTFGPEQVSEWQTSANSTPLNPGTYVIRIHSGTFSYWTDHPDFEPEPWVILWLSGGRFINQRTNIEVSTTWTTLNGYNDALKLEVIEATTICAFFLDTYKDDNSGQVTLSILPSN